MEAVHVTPSRGFTRVPNTILRGEYLRPDGKRISPTARLLYALILDASHAGDRACTASEQTLGKRLGGMSERHVRTLVRELQSAGLIVVRREGRGVSNTIFPQVVPERKADSGHDRNGASGEQEPRTAKNEGVDRDRSQSGDVGGQP